MSKLILIDGNAILHRAYHAMPPFTTTKGEPIGAVHGFVSMLLKVISDLKPTDIAVAFDEKAPTFRQDLLPTYQAQRPPMERDLSSQFDKAKDFLKAAGIPVYSKPGYEADDVIGTIATQYSSMPNYKLQITNKNSEFRIQNSELNSIVIVTGDRDQLQLVDNKLNIKLYMPVLGLSNAKLYGETETKERMGVGPKLIDDYKALVGDPSDNYGGVPGIGPKTAINLLEKYGSFNGVYEHISDISESTAKKLKAGEEGGKTSKKLATIVRDVPIDVDYEAMSKWKINSPEVTKLFEEFGFKTLTKRINDVGRKIEEEKQMTLL